MRKSNLSTLEWCSKRFFEFRIPIAIIFGNNYYNNQHRVDHAMMFSNESGTIKFYKLLFDLKTNSADPKEVEAFKKMLHKFEEQSKVTFLK